MTKLLIVGAGMATARLVSELVRHEADFEIEIIGDERSASYNRILLSSILSGEKTEADLLLLPENWYREHRITVRTGETVTDIDPQNHTCSTDSGNRTSYDKLILATGSKPFLPPVPGIDSSGVFTFRNYQDLVAIQNAAKSSHRAVVIGGGLLGLEAATGLLSLGLEVIVVNREKHLMPRQLDQAGAQILKQALDKRGMQFRLGVTPVNICDEDEVARGVDLSSGEKLECDMVLVAAGILPNKSLAAHAGINCNRGVLVSDRLETSEADIFAIGECCELAGRLFGTVAPIHEQAKVLSALLAGKPITPYLHRDTTTSLKISGISVVSTGQLPFSDSSTSRILTDSSAGIYRRLVFDGNSLTGYILVGDRRHSSMYDRLINCEPPETSPDMMFAGQCDSENSVFTATTP